MKRRDLNYLIFTGIGSIVAVGACLAIFLVATRQTKPITEYSSYSYSEYINRSESKTYESNAGAQLFEAESLTLAGSAKVSDNIHASQQKIVSSLSTGSTLSLDFKASKSGDAKLVFSTSYISQTNHSIFANNLFKITFNNADISLTSSITPSYNEFDFIENDIALLNIKNGINNLTIVSYNNLYTLDYLLLVSPEEKTSTEECMKYHQEYFASTKRKQMFEAEIQNDVSGAVVLEDYSATGGYSTYFTSPGDILNYHVFSDAQTKSKLSLRVRKVDSSRSAPGVSIKVNQNDIPISPMSNIKDSYTDIDFGQIDLVEGMNEINISNLGGSFILDSISLNSNINFSNSISQLRFEAEDGLLNGGCSTVIASTTESKNAVGYNFAGSYVEYKLTSLEPATSHIALRLSYVGNSQPLDEVVQVQVNGFKIKNHSKEILNSTGDYNKYVDIYAGSFSLPKGDNIIRIVSISGYYNLDNIVFFDSEVNADENSDMIEAENTLTYRFNTHYNQSASNFYCLKNTVVDSTSVVYFYSAYETNLNLRANLSCPSPLDYYVDEFFSLYINNNICEINPGAKIISSSTTFINLEIGNFSIKQGLNVLKISNFDLVYYLDYLLLTI